LERVVHLSESIITMRFFILVVALGIQ